MDRPREERTAHDGLDEARETGRARHGEPSRARGLGHQRSVLRAHHARLLQRAANEVAALVARIEGNHGRLDVLVNDIRGGDSLTEWGRPFRSCTLEHGLRMQTRAVHTRVITCHHAAPLMVRRRRGLVVEITEGENLDPRWHLYRDLAKVSVIRPAWSMAEELLPHGVTALALTPGCLRSEAVLDHRGVTEETRRDGVARDPHLAASETPSYVGRAVAAPAALAADPHTAREPGGLFASWDLAAEYGFTDVDGTRPNRGRYFSEHVGARRARRGSGERGSGAGSREQGAGNRGRRSRLADGHS